MAFSSGTAALHGAAAAAGLGPGDTVTTTALSFSASANAARYVGAAVALADIDPDTLNLDPAAVPRDTDALIAVHYAGLPFDLRSLDTRPRVVIEDAAHAIGALTPDGAVGNCAHSDMCCFSFHPVKTITTTEGGAVTTNDRVLADRLRRFRHHGIQQPSTGPAWQYDIEELGYNYRLSDIHAALGSSQLRRLDAFVAERNRLAERYRSLLEDLPITLPPEAEPGWRHGYHLFAVRVDHRRRVYEMLRSRGIGVQVHYVPIHHLTAYEDLEVSLPRTDEAYERLLSLPLFPSLGDADQDQVVEALRSSL